MKKIISLVFSLVLIVFFTGCQKSQEVQNAVHPVKYTITFVAGEHGLVNPSTPQSVIQGGNTIPVYATADPDYKFDKWTGTGGFISTTNNPLTVKNITTNMTITANFTSTTDKKYTITFQSTIGGSITGILSQSINPGGSTSPVTETPDTNYTFVNWTGTGGFTPKTDNPLTVTNVSSDITITANFTPQTTTQYTITFVAGSGGTLNGTDKTIIVKVNPGGSVVNPPTAIADSGYEFDKVKGWTCSDGTSHPQNPLPPINNITENRTYTANFSLKPITQYTVNFSAGNGGSINGQTTQIVNEHSSTTSVTAVPNTGYHFVNWSGDYTSINLTIIIPDVISNMTIIANFAANPTHIVNFDIDAHDYGSLSGNLSQTVIDGGDTTPVTVLINPGCIFVKWVSTDWNFYSIDNPLTIHNVKTNMSILAKMSRSEPYTVNFLAGSNGTLSGPTTQRVNGGCGTSPVTAIPNSGYHFVNWTGTGGFISIDNPLPYTVIHSDMTITANFAANPPPPMCESVQFDTTSSLYFDMGVNSHTLDTLLGRYGINYPRGLPIPLDPSVHISIIVTDSNSYTIAITVNNIVIKNNSDYSYSSINVRYEIYQETSPETSLVSGSIGNYTLQPNGSQELILNVSTNYLPTDSVSVHEGDGIRIKIWIECN